MKQVHRDTTAAIVDGIVKLLAGGGLLATTLVLPNAAQALDKPFGKLLKGFDQRQKERELRRILYYMKSRGLIKYDPKDYEHGIKLTQKGAKRLKKINFDQITIPSQKPWDSKWRLVFFDIPEIERTKRNALNQKLKVLGFKQLQFSIWVHPFPCRQEIEAVCEILTVRPYVSYVEITDIDSKKQLQKRFKSMLS